MVTGQKGDTSKKWRLAHVVHPKYRTPWRRVTRRVTHVSTLPVHHFRFVDASSRYSTATCTRAAEYRQGSSANKLYAEDCAHKFMPGDESDATLYHFAVPWCYMCCTVPRMNCCIVIPTIPLLPHRIVTARVLAFAICPSEPFSRNICHLHRLPNQK